MASSATLPDRINVQANEPVNEVRNLQQELSVQLTSNRGKAYGIAARIANPELIRQEQGAFEQAMVLKHTQAL